MRWRQSSRLARGAALGWLLLALAFAAAQTPDIDRGLPDPIPRPMPPRQPPKDAPAYESLIPESDLPWEVPDELRSALFERAEVYRDFMVRFTCREEARVAEYDTGGEVKKETTRRYGYLLRRTNGETVDELRQEVAKDGALKAEPARDEDPFPPAYAWVFLFSRKNETYFSMRYLGDRFDGFDWVHEIQFRGALPFTDGKDIRQWEGVALVDAATYNPLEIRVEPSGQLERIEALYRNWSKSFNIVGMRTAPRPLGFRGGIQFRLQRDGLSFPTELRYDTFRAVAPGQIVPVRASIRTYQDYRITTTTTRPSVGEAVRP